MAFNFLDIREADKFYERVTSKLKNKLEKIEHKAKIEEAPQVKPREKNNVVSNENDNYLTPDNPKTKQPNEMKNILKELNIKPNRKTIKIVSQFIYDHGGGVDKFKENIKKYKLEPPRNPPPKIPKQLSLPPGKVPELPETPPVPPPNPFARKNKQIVMQNAFDNDGYAQFESINAELIIKNDKITKRKAPPPPLNIQPYLADTPALQVETQQIMQSPPPLKPRIIKQNLNESETLKLNVENETQKPGFLKAITTFNRKTLKVTNKLQNEEKEQKRPINDDGFDEIRKAIADICADKKSRKKLFIF